MTTGASMLFFGELTVSVYREKNGHGRKWLSSIISVSGPSGECAASCLFLLFEGILTAAKGANILLTYFHYCNKGLYPFSQDCKDSDLQNLAELDESSLDFVKRTRVYVEEHSKYMLLLAVI